MAMRIQILTAALVLLVTSCGSDATTPTEPSVAPSPPVTTAPPAPGTTPVAEGVALAMSDVGRAEPVGIAAPSVQETVAGDLELGLALLRLDAEPDGNSFLSPYSVASALGMTLAGARGETAAEMEAVLGTSDAATYHAGRNAVDAAIAEPGAAPVDGESEAFTLRGANTVFSQAGFELASEYLDLLARYYGVGVQLVDFVADPEAARTGVNDWVEEQTEDRIVDLIPPGVVTVDTRVVLVNAVYFKANWLNEFDSAATAPGEFQTASGPTTVDYMRGSVPASYAAGEGYEAIRLPYIGNTTSMLIVVPDDLESFLATVDAERIGAISEAMLPHQMELTMPKFEFTSDLALKGLLRQLGMEQAFVPPAGTSGADLTGMHEQRVLFVQDAIHQAFVSVDEEGTEAAAATAVVVGLTSALTPATMDIDQPFIFIIENDATGAPIFIGQVGNPAQG